MMLALQPQLGVATAAAAATWYDAQDRSASEQSPANCGPPSTSSFSSQQVQPFHADASSRGSTRNNTSNTGLQDLRVTSDSRMTAIDSVSGASAAAGDGSPRAPGSKHSPRSSGLHSSSPRTQLAGAYNPSITSHHHANGATGSPRGSIPMRASALSNSPRDGDRLATEGRSLTSAGLRPISNSSGSGGSLDALRTSSQRRSISLQAGLADTSSSGGNSKLISAASGHGEGMSAWGALAAPPQAALAPSDNSPRSAAAAGMLSPRSWAAVEPFSAGMVEGSGGSPRSIAMTSTNRSGSGHLGTTARSLLPPSGLQMQSFSEASAGASAGVSMGSPSSQGLTPLTTTELPSPSAPQPSATGRRTQRAGSLLIRDDPIPEPAASTAAGDSLAVHSPTGALKGHRGGVRKQPSEANLRSMMDYFKAPTGTSSPGSLVVDTEGAGTQSGSGAEGVTMQPTPSRLRFDIPTPTDAAARRTSGEVSSAAQDLPSARRAATSTGLMRVFSRMRDTSSGVDGDGERKSNGASLLGYISTRFRASLDMGDGSGRISTEGRNRAISIDEDPNRRTDRSSGGGTSVRKSFAWSEAFGSNKPGPGSDAGEGHSRHQSFMGMGSMFGSRTSRSRRPSFFGNLMSESSAADELEQPEPEPLWYSSLEQFGPLTFTFLDTPQKSVHFARCLLTKRHFLLKRFDKALMTPAQQRSSSSEVAFSQLLEHEHIIQCHGTWEQGEHTYVVEEYAMHGGMLQDLTHHPEKYVESFVATDVVVPLLKALVYLHGQSIIHRAIFPENLRWSRDHKLRLCHFGEAIDSRMYTPNDRIAYLDYMAPEMLSVRDPAAPQNTFELNAALRIRANAGQSVPKVRRRSALHQSIGNIGAFLGAGLGNEVPAVRTSQPILSSSTSAPFGGGLLDFGSSGLDFLPHAAVPDRRGSAGGGHAAVQDVDSSMLHARQLSQALSRHTTSEIENDASVDRGGGGGGGGRERGRQDKSAPKRKNTLTALLSSWVPGNNADNQADLGIRKMSTGDLAGSRNSLLNNLNARASGEPSIRSGTAGMPQPSPPHNSIHPGTSMLATWVPAAAATNAPTYAVGLTGGYSQAVKPQTLRGDISPAVEGGMSSPEAGGGGALRQPIRRKLTNVGGKAEAEVDDETAWPVRPVNSWEWQDQYSDKVDVWQIGCLLHEILCHCLPFEANNKQLAASLILWADVEKFTDTLTPQCVDFIQACLTKNPEDRPSASELLEHPWIVAHLAGERLPTAHELKFGISTVQPDKDKAEEDQPETWQSMFNDAAGAMRGWFSQKSQKSTGLEVIDTEKGKGNKVAPLM